MKGGLDDDVTSRNCAEISVPYSQNIKSLKFVNSNAFSSPTITVLNEEN